MSENFTGAISRRQLLTVLSAGVASISGCGGGGGDGTSPIASNGTSGTSSTTTDSGTTTTSNGTNPAAPSPLPADTSLVRGTIALAEVGGSNLRVNSAYWMNNPVSGGTFSTVASNTGVQLLILSDSSGGGNDVIRALTLSIPGVVGIEFSAASTSSALIMLTLGILTVDQLEARQRITAIQALPSFARFAAYLAARLPNADLVALNKESQFLGLRKTVASEFMALPVAKTSAPIRLNQIQSAIRLEGGSAISNSVGATYVRPVNADAAATVGLTNSGLRFLSVARERLDSSNHVLGTPSFPMLKGAQVPGTFTQQANLMGGVNVLSWGNLATLQVGSAGTATDQLTLPNDSAVAAYRYYFVGPGVRGGATLPPELTFDQFGLKAATTATAFFYVLGPLLDIVGGTSTILKKLGVASLTAGQEVLSALGGLTVNTGGVDGALNSGDTGNTVGALIDFSLAMLGTGLALVEALSIGTTAPEALAFAAAVSALAGALSGVMGLLDVDAAVLSLLAHPRVESVDVAVNGVGTRYKPALLPMDAGVDHPAKSINQNGSILYTAVDYVAGTTEVHILKGGVDRVVLSFTVQVGLTLVVTNLNDEEHFGYSISAGDRSQAFLYKNGISIDLGIDPALIVRPLAINNNDEVVIATTSAQRASKYRVMVSRDTMNGRKVTAIAADFPEIFGIWKCIINNTGQIALDANTGDPDLHVNEVSWIWLIANGQAEVIYTNQGIYTIGDQANKHLVDLNDAGVILVSAEDSRVTPPAQAIQEALIWKAGVFQQIATYTYSTQFGSYTVSSGQAITDAGQVLGSVVYNADNSSAQFLEDLIDYTSDVPKGYPLPILSGRSQLDFICANKVGQMIVTIAVLVNGGPATKTIFVLLTPT